MNPAHIDPLILGVGVLALLGVLVAFRTGARTGSRVAHRSRQVSRMGATLTRALLIGAVIAGAQAAVVTTTTDPIAWGVALGLPAVFAGAALARVFVVTTLEHEHPGHGRGVRR